MPFDRAAEDYFLTNLIMREELEKPLPSGMVEWPRQTRENLFLVYPRYLELFISAAEEAYGGLEGYLSQRLKLSRRDLCSLREFYTE